MSEIPEEYYAKNTPRSNANESPKMIDSLDLYSPLDSFSHNPSTQASRRNSRYFNPDSDLDQLSPQGVDTDGAADDVTNIPPLPSKSHHKTHYNGIKKAQSHHVFKVDPDNRKEHEFINENQRGWTHGVHPPFTVFKYSPALTLKDRALTRRHQTENLLVPKAVIEECSNGSIQTGSTSDSSGDDKEHDEFASDLFNNEATTTSFSAYYSVPETSINIPPATAELLKAHGTFDLAHICYQNHHDINDMTFTFGGLLTMKFVNLKMLGLPIDCDPSRISVQFNCDLPPHLNRDTLSSPYLVQNLQMYIFNPIRGTVTFLEPGFDCGESPSHINAMTSTQVSYRHVFFYGGFNISVDSVYFDPTINRWIVRKRLVMNEDGYLLDIVTYKFTKITLKTKDGQPEINLGRIGHMITSDKYDKEQFKGKNVPERAPSPPIFSEHKYKPARNNNVNTTSTNNNVNNNNTTQTHNGSSYAQNPGSPSTLKQSTLPTLPPKPSASSTSLNAHISGKSGRGEKLPQSPAKQKSFSSMINAKSGQHPPPPSPANNQTSSVHTSTEPSTPESELLPTSSSIASSASSFLMKGTNKVSRSGTNNSNNSSSTNSSSGTTSRIPPALANLKNGSNINSASSSSSSSSAGAGTGGGPTSKMSNVLSKSSRIFHRNHQRQPSNNNTVQNKAVPNPPPSDKPSGSHPLKNTYSKQVKQRRSNSGSSHGNQHPHPLSQPPAPISGDAPSSRSGSPGRGGSSTSSHQSKSNLGASGSPLTETFNKKEPVQVNDALSVDYRPSLGPTPYYSNAQFVASHSNASANPTVLRQTAENNGNNKSINSPSGFNTNNANNAPDPSSLRLSDSQHESKSEEHSIADSTDSNLRRPLFGEPSEQSGITTISVFVFGGFTCHLDPTDPHHKIFKASSDLLKIELVVQEDAKRSMFVEDATVYLIGNEEYCKSKETLTKNGNTQPDNQFIWPAARGYFGSAVIDHNPSLDYNIRFNGGKLSSCRDAASQPDQLLSNETIESLLESDGLGHSDHSNSKSSFVLGLDNSGTRPKSHGQYFDGKALVIHGGINEHYETNADFYIFIFRTGKWYTFQTYLYNYFDNHIQPYEDDDVSSFEPGKEVAHPKLVEAELRACHHASLYYKNEESEYLVFVGGFSNDYLRFFDKKPYTSNKYDVSRLAKFTFQTSNPNLNRVAVLNLRTQTFKFLKYFSDMKHTFSEKELYKIYDNPAWTNARISNFGGALSLNGKTITICHGVLKVVPEKKEDFALIEQELSPAGTLWGAHVHFIFPTL